jgi:bifunctional oligoribonuclease and PAP phosphatase NrnA
MWRSIKKFIQEHQSFLITTHVNPDGDGVGSACALADLLKIMGKTVRFVCEGQLPSKFSFLDFDHRYEMYEPGRTYEEVEVIIVVDANSRDRLGRVGELIDLPGMITVVIDHHQPTESMGPYAESMGPYYVLDPSASSTGSMIYTLYKECGYELTREAAMGLYVSVISDTGRFCYSSTDRKAHKIAEECMKRGVDPDLMYAKIYQQVTLPEFKVFAKALQHMEEHFEGRVIVQKILLEDYVGVPEEVHEILQSDLEYFHEFNKIIAGVECVVLLCEMPGNEVRISLRASGNYRVDRIAMRLGGGGHAKAAGAKLKGTVDAVMRKVLTEILSEEGSFV